MVDSQRDRLEEVLSAEHCGGLRVRSGADAVPVCLLHELLLINADEVACHGVPEAASEARAYLGREAYLSAGALQTCRITPVLRARPVPRAPGGISCAQFGRYPLETRDESYFGLGTSGTASLSIATMAPSCSCSSFKMSS